MKPKIRTERSFINVSMRDLAAYEWNRFPSCWLFVVIKSSNIKKFLPFLSVSSISSLNISAVYK